MAVSDGELGQERRGGSSGLLKSKDKCVLFSSWRTHLLWLFSRRRLDNGPGVG